MKIPRIFQYADTTNRYELLNYAIYTRIYTNTSNSLYISETFVLNDYRICYIIYDRCICVLVKKNNENIIYTGYTIYLRKVKSEYVGELPGLSHYVPTIILTYKWDNINMLLYHIHLYLEKVFKINLSYDDFENHLIMNNFLKEYYLDDADYGINEYERYNQQWVHNNVCEKMEYFDI